MTDDNTAIADAAPETTASAATEAPAFRRSQRDRIDSSSLASLVHAVIDLAHFCAIRTLTAALFGLLSRTFAGNVERSFQQLRIARSWLELAARPGPF